LRILAIDPGSMLGWATNATGRLEWGTEDFRIKRGESSGNRWRRFGEWLRHVSVPYVSHPSMVPKAYTPDPVDLIIYEVAHFMPKARAAAEIAAGFTTRLEEHCERHGIALQPVPVQTLKAFAIPKVKRKVGDPKMDRGKEAMIRAAMLRLPQSYGLEGWRSATEGKTVPLTEHEADALWAYWWAEKNCSRHETYEATGL